MTNLTERVCLRSRCGAFSSLCFSSGAGRVDSFRRQERGPSRWFTTTTVLKHFVEVLGKDRVRAYSIGKPYQDPHLTQATPQDILRIRKAQISIWTGSDEEEWTERPSRARGIRS